MKMNVDVGAEVVDKHKPTDIQTHGKKHVKADWQKDMHLGIIDCVPDGSLIGWLHR